MRSILPIVVVALACARDAVGDAASSLRGASESEAKTGGIDLTGEYTKQTDGGVVNVRQVGSSVTVGDNPPWALSGRALTRGDRTGTVSGSPGAFLLTFSTGVVLEQQPRPQTPPLWKQQQQQQQQKLQATTQVNSTGVFETLASLWCEPVGGVCGGPWKWPKKCCGNAKCQKLLGGDGTMKCVEEHPEQQCVPIHGECGGPGRRTETCCHGKCESQSFVGGNGIMKCVDKQCAAQHAECGGPGRQTLPCCAPELSCKSPFGSAVMKCM